MSKIYAYNQYTLRSVRLRVWVRRQKRLWKRRVMQVLEAYNHDHWVAKLFDGFMIGLISLSVLAFAFETVYSISIPYKSHFNNFETFSSLVFTAEYVLRLWACTLRQGYRHPIWGRIKFALRPLSIIDLLSILPFYLFLFFQNLVFIREIHLLRLVRLLKISRYSSSIRTLGKVVSAKRNDLLSAIFTVFTLLMISASLVYFVEHAAQPELFPSIPASMWWSVVTLTSVGYGDVYPVTPIGKLLGGVIAVLGLGLVALPTGILASGFAEEVQRTRELPVCPHCGKDLH